MVVACIRLWFITFSGALKVNSNLLHQSRVSASLAEMANDLVYDLTQRIIHWDISIGRPTKNNISTVNGLLFLGRSLLIV